MIVLRILGFAVAAVLLILAARGFGRRTLRLPDALIMAGVAVALGFVSLTPSAVDPLLRELGFPPGDARRVIGVLVLSNILVFVLLLRSFANTDKLDRRFGDFADRLAARKFAEEFGPDRNPAGTQKLAVVIPALNEESSLPDVLASIPRSVHGLAVECIVVSDGSIDATEDAARLQGALVVRRDLRRGQGAAVALGYRIGLLRGAAVVATLDADGQYDPLELPQLVKPILDGEADVVHGSRILGKYESPIKGRQQGVRLFAWLTTKLARSPITDPASGFRAFSPEALKVLEFRENQFHASEVTVAASKRDLRVREVPCTFRERAAGTTKKPPFLKYGYGYTRSLLRTWLG
ncbi:MAG: glycosyltransferase family 2 protein [Actinomycetota bacterium]